MFPNYNVIKYTGYLHLVTMPEVLHRYPKKQDPRRLLVSTLNSDFSIDVSFSVDVSFSIDVNFSVDVTVDFRSI